jgi:hypothetical protein
MRIQIWQNDADPDLQLLLKIQRHGIRRLIYLYIFQHGHLRFVAVGHGDPLGDVQHDGNGVVRQHAHR